MSTISPDQLPSPIQPFAAPAVRQAATSHPLNTRMVTMAVGGLLLLGGTFAMKAHSNGNEPAARPARTTERTHTTETDDTANDDSATIDTATIDTGARGGQVGAADVAQTYSMIFGVQGSTATLECVAGALNSDEDLLAEVAEWTTGAQLSQADAQAVFTPFAACAPNDDFLAEMVPAAIAVVGGSADEACVANILVGFGVEGRAEAHALAATDSDEFANRMYSTFIGCVG